MSKDQDNFEMKKKLPTGGFEQGYVKAEFLYIIDSNPHKSDGG